MIKTNFIIEEVGPHTKMMFEVEKIILETKTKFQFVQIVDLYQFGRCLILDGFIQSTERDEYIYHESLVHPIMTTHPKPEDVLIIGGAEGATLREVLKHNTVKNVTMVDIDEELIKYTKEHLYIMHRGAFNDNRLKLKTMDGYKYILNTEDKQFDIIILDLTDPYSSKIAEKLYSEDFYKEIKRVLKDEGMMVTQAGNSFFYPEAYKNTKENISLTFKSISEYWVWIPSFGYACNYITASEEYNPKNLKKEDVDKTLESRKVSTKIYNGKFHESIYLRDIIIGDAI